MWDAALGGLTAALAAAGSEPRQWVRPLFLCKSVRRLVVHGAPGVSGEDEAVAFWDRVVMHLRAVLGWLAARSGGGGAVGGITDGDVVVGVERVAYQLMAMIDAVRGRRLRAAACRHRASSVCGSGV